ncbi:MAG: DUF2382 domain-containing protein [Cyanobacteria bacterium P01_G01_bin.39]
MTLSNSNEKQTDLNSQLSKLDKQLISYQVLDRQGIARAEVKDIYYDVNNEINLLIELKSINNQLNLHRLEHTDICHINLDDKLILSNLSQRQLENSPLYQSVPTHIKEALSQSSLYDDCEMNPSKDDIDIKQQSDSLEIETIPLLEEKLQVAHHKQKVGEVIVRKQVETKIVEVPLRREKLIVERIGKNPEQLTEVVIGSGEVNGFQYNELNDHDRLHLTNSHFLDLPAAHKLLEAITQFSAAANTKIRLEIVTDSAEHQLEYQNICDRIVASEDNPLEQN